MTNGRDRNGISREEVARDGGWTTTVLRMERAGGMVSRAVGYTGVHVNAVQYPTPPASAEIKHGRLFKRLEGRGLVRTTVPAVQH